MLDALITVLLITSLMLGIAVIWYEDFIK